MCNNVLHTLTDVGYVNLGPAKVATYMYTERILQVYAVCVVNFRAMWTISDFVQFAHMLLEYVVVNNTTEHYM